MKTMRLLIVALVVTISVLGSLGVQGQTPNSIAPPPFVLPSLPTGTNIANLFDWAASNRSVYAAFTLRYKTKSGTSAIYNFPGVPREFDSYAAYFTFLKSNVLNAVASISSNADSTSLARLSASFGYDPSEPYVPTLIDTNGVALGNITSDWLDSVVPLYLNIMISVPGLQRFTVEADDGSGKVYSNGWSSVSGTTSANSIGSQHPPELTTSNWLVLNPWYLLLHGHHVRFTATVGGQTTVYTQYGALLSLAYTTISPDGSYVGVNYAPGANTILQCSTNLRDWNTIATISETNTVTSKVFACPRDTPWKFFRSHSD